MSLFNILYCAFTILFCFCFLTKLAIISPGLCVHVSTDDSSLQRNCVPRAPQCDVGYVGAVRCFSELIIKCDLLWRTWNKSQATSV